VREVQRGPCDELAREPANRGVVRRGEGDTVPRVEGIERERADHEEVSRAWTRSRHGADERERKKKASCDERKESAPSPWPAGRETRDERGGREEDGNGSEESERLPQKTRAIGDPRHGGKSTRARSTNVDASVEDLRPNPETHNQGIDLARCARLRGESP
jgi:hypothetical protein